MTQDELMDAERPIDELIADETPPSAVELVAMSLEDDQAPANGSDESVPPAPEAEPLAEPADASPEAPVEQPPVEADAAEEPAPAPKGTRVAWWPFIVNGVLWIGLAASSYLLLTSTQAALPAFRQDSYPYLVLAGLVLTLLGPIVSLAAWLFAWFKAKKPERGGMLTTALVRGAVVTFLGVVVWWGVLVLVDALRLGLV